jgi:hypothetical protein
MRERIRKYFLCLCLSVAALFSPGCVIRGHGGGSGGGGGNGGKGPPPGAMLTSLSPLSATAGGPPFTLTISGSNFVPGGSITWNNQNIGPYTFVSSSSITIPIGGLLIASAGTVSIVVQVPNFAASNTLTFTINPFTSSACILFGMYNFFFTGFDSSGPVTIAGDFGVDASGNVSGEEDFKDLTTTDAAQSITGGSCKNSSTPNEGTLTVTTAAGTSTYTFVAQSSGAKGRMAESGDTNGISGSGRFVSTPPSGFFSGDYVIALVGSDSGGNRMGVLGRFTDSDNNSFSMPGTLSNGEGDINDNGALTPQAQITGSVSVPDVYSRCVATLTVGTHNFQIAFYVISSFAGFGIDVDSGTGTPLLAGFIGNQANPGLYSRGNLSAPIVLSSWGVVPGSPASSDTSIGLATGFNPGPGTFNVQLDSVTASVPSLNQSITGATYSIATNGRGIMTFTPTGGTPQTYTFYLDDFNDGYMLQTSGNVGFGFFQAQASSALVNGTFLGGTWFSAVATSPNTATEITLNSGSISGALAGTYSIPPGSSRGTATVNQPLFGSNDLVFYILNTNAMVVMGSDGVTNGAIAFLHL